MVNNGKIINEVGEIKKNVKFLGIVVFGLLGIILMTYLSEKQIENQSLIENRMEQVTKLLQEKLEHYDPVLESFVDHDYISVLSSKVNSKGICRFERGLAKNKDPFGSYVVIYNLKNMEVLSKELIISNNKYLDEWNTFIKK
ncbi:hypothetical protein ACFSCX_11580 [Bacillus salitolerans]|uniref:Uncharacterized protein n=1 Tax=Bacillus salitolerans TaxID=1437434 RepID=A0ABW4LQ79_9BACI